MSMPEQGTQSGLLEELALRRRRGKRWKTAEEVGGEKSTAASRQPLDVSASAAYKFTLTTS